MRAWKWDNGIPSTLLPSAAPAQPVPVEGQRRDVQPPGRLLHGDRGIRKQCRGCREVLVGEGSRRPSAGPAMKGGQLYIH